MKLLSSGNQTQKVIDITTGNQKSSSAAMIEGDIGFDMMPVSELSNSIDEQSLIKEVHNLMQRDQDRQREWTALHQILLTAIRSNLNSSSKLRAEVSNFILSLLSEQKLSSAWGMISNAYLQDYKAAAYKGAQQLLTEYRIVSNFFGSYGAFIIDAREYMHLIALSLVHYIDNSNLRKAHDELTAVAAIIKSLPIDFFSTLVGCMCDKPQEGIIIIDYLPSDFILQSAYLLLKRKFSSYREKSSSSALLSESSDKDVAVSKILIARAFVDCFPVTVIDSLLLQKPFTCDIAELVVNMLPKSSYIDVLDTIGSYWGEQLFVSKGDASKQEYLTVALISILKRITGTPHIGRSFIVVSPILLYTYYCSS